MLEIMKALIRSRDICVLSTVSEGEPHCSLMSYVTDENCREFYMITSVETRKYRDLEGNNAVSLLIDSREEDVNRERNNIKALTVSGIFQKIGDAAKEKAVSRQLLGKNPHLREFAESGDAKVFAVRVKSFQLLEGVSRSHFEKIE